MTDTALIMEDELFVASTLKTLLPRKVYPDCALRTVKAIFRTLERQRPACAILDVRLPDGEVFPAADGCAN